MGIGPGRDEGWHPFDVARSSGIVGAVSRVLMTWDRPHHLSDAAGQQWVRTEVRRLAAIPGVESVSLSRSAGSRRYRPAHDWICELQLSDGTSGDLLLADSVCAEWLRDLRALGMRPELAVLEATQEVTADPDARQRREHSLAAAPGPRC